MPFLIPIGAAIAGSVIAGSGAKKAATTQADAEIQTAQLQKQTADQALAFQKQQYADQVQREQPWLDTGNAALGKINALQPFQAPTTVDEQNDPGYQFRLAEGQKALERSAAARGTPLGGGALKAAARYGQDYSSNEYGNVYARRMGEYQQNYNQLAGQAGLGQTATNNLGTLGNSLSGQASNTLMNSANQQGLAMNNAAAARASGYVTNANTTGNLVSTAGAAGGQGLADWLAARRQPQQGLDLFNYTG